MNYISTILILIFQIYYTVHDKINSFNYYIYAYLIQRTVYINEYPYAKRDSDLKRINIYWSTLIRTHATKRNGLLYVMKRVGSALDQTATGSDIAAGALNCLNTRR